jgi:hypothetical protein
LAGYDVWNNLLDSGETHTATLLSKFDIIIYNSRYKNHGSEVMSNWTVIARPVIMGTFPTTEASRVQNCRFGVLIIATSLAAAMGQPWWLPHFEPHPIIILLFFVPCCRAHCNY